MKRPKPQSHWTEASIEDYKSRITFDFLDQLLERMNELPLNQAQLADKLGVGESAVSQILNNSTNLKLETLIRYTRALGLKLSLLAYDDGDPGNTRGPIGSDVFEECWKRLGKPADMYAFEEGVAKVINGGFYHEESVPHGNLVRFPRNSTQTKINTVDLADRTYKMAS